ncbi:MAG: hypothetical protein E6G60_00885 [Actinobacteria bacterium]|nr:MAG: hypothetical protein E6G60_00885 [Actinomycetota bacterium]
MRRWFILPVLLASALVLAAVGAADPGDGKNKGKGHEFSAKGGKLTLQVTTTDHGCSFRPWATDKLSRTYKVRKNEDGSYTVRREDKGTFTTLAGLSPGADPCPTVIRKGKHGTTLLAGVTGKIHGYIQGTVTGGTFNANGKCTAECTNTDFIAGFFTAGAKFTCIQGYAGCRFNFAYTAQKQEKQKLKFHHWVDRGLDGVNETFIGDIANS